MSIYLCSGMANYPTGLDWTELDLHLLMLISIDGACGLFFLRCLCCLLRGMYHRMCIVISVVLKLVYYINYTQWSRTEPQRHCDPAPTPNPEEYYEVCYFKNDLSVLFTVVCQGRSREYYPYHGLQCRC